MATQAEIDNWYAYHAPNPYQLTVYDQIRAKGKELAELFNELAPSSADATAAHRELRAVIRSMNAAIACNS